MDDKQCVWSYSGRGGLAKSNWTPPWNKVKKSKELHLHSEHEIKYTCIDSTRTTAPSAVFKSDYEYASWHCIHIIDRHMARYPFHKKEVRYAPTISNSSLCHNLNWLLWYISAGPNEAEILYVVPQDWLNRCPRHRMLKHSWSLISVSSGKIRPVDFTTT